MARAERGSVFSYQEYSPYRILKLYPRHTTEKQFRSILKRCVGTNSAVIIRIATKSIFIRPETFMEQKNRSSESQKEFLDITARILKEGEKVSLKIPTFMFSNN